MNELVVQIDALRSQPMAIEYELEPSALELEDSVYTFVSPVRGHFNLRMIGHDDVLGQGELSLSVQSACVRCLAPTGCELKVKLGEVWLKEIPFEEPSELADDISLTRHLQGEQIELAEVLRELIMAELPERMLCGEQCRGLCPTCGANMNTEPCDCARKQSSQENMPEWKKKLKGLSLD